MTTRNDRSDTAPPRNVRPLPHIEARRAGVFFCKSCGKLVKPTEPAISRQLGKREHLACAERADLVAKQRELLGRAFKLDRQGHAVQADRLWDEAEACRLELVALASRQLSPVGLRPNARGARRCPKA